MLGAATVVARMDLGFGARKMPHFCHKMLDFLAGTGMVARSIPETANSI